MIDVNYESTRGNSGVANTGVADNDASTCNVLCVCSCVLRCYVGLNMSTKVCVLFVIVFGCVHLLTSKYLHDFDVAWNVEPTTIKLAFVHSSFARIWLSTCFWNKRQQMKSFFECSCAFAKKITVTRSALMFSHVECALTLHAGFQCSPDTRHTRPPCSISASPSVENGC